MHACVRVVRLCAFGRTNLCNLDFSDRAISKQRSRSLPNIFPVLHASDSRTVRASSISNVEEDSAWASHGPSMQSHYVKGEERWELSSDEQQPLYNGPYLTDTDADSLSPNTDPNLVRVNYIVGESLEAMAAAVEAGIAGIEVGEAGALSLKDLSLSQLLSSEYSSHNDAPSSSTSYNNTPYNNTTYNNSPPRQSNGRSGRPLVSGSSNGFASPSRVTSLGQRSPNYSLNTSPLYKSSYGPMTATFDASAIFAPSSPYPYPKSNSSWSNKAKQSPSRQNNDHNAYNAHLRSTSESSHSPSLSPLRRVEALELLETRLEETERAFEQFKVAYESPPREVGRTVSQVARETRLPTHRKGLTPMTNSPLRPLKYPPEGPSNESGGREHYKASKDGSTLSSSGSSSENGSRSHQPLYHRDELDGSSIKAKYEFSTMERVIEPPTPAPTVYELQVQTAELELQALQALQAGIAVTKQMQQMQQQQQQQQQQQEQYKQEQMQSTYYTHTLSHISADTNTDPRTSSAQRQYGVPADGQTHETHRASPYRQFQSDGQTHETHRASPYRQFQSPYRSTRYAFLQQVVEEALTPNTNS